MLRNYEVLKSDKAEYYEATRPQYLCLNQLDFKQKKYFLKIKQPHPIKSVVM